MNTDQEPRSKTILVVDDAPENITILKGILSDLYRIRPAIHGRAALKAVRIEPIPDLILLDVMMPEMDGHAVCRHLKEDPLTREIPVIFITGLSDDADELLGLELGAVDYITKPIRPAIVRARVQTQLALREASRTIERQNLLLTEEREMIENIVLRMRGADPFSTRRVRHLYHPVEQTAGDLLLSASTPDGRQRVLLGDFTGHGLTAAIGGPLVAYIFQSMTARGDSGPELFQEINNQLHTRLPTGIFFAATLVELDPRRQQALILNAAMPETLLIHPSAPPRRVTSTFHPLGVSVMPDSPTLAAPVMVQPGEKIYLYTDGIVEAASPTGEMFGITRLEAMLIHPLWGGAPLETILTRLQAHCQCDTHDDDIAMIEMEI
ncbi:MAG: SpoIIE family protein phosphatase [Magnetococcales bacterium]|nr:SpoIIE family protein phosphatase [Magnetococcales bacterium]